MCTFSANVAFDKATNGQLQRVALSKAKFAKKLAALFCLVHGQKAFIFNLLLCVFICFLWTLHLAVISVFEFFLWSELILQFSELRSSFPHKPPFLVTTFDRGNEENKNNASVCNQQTRGSNCARTIDVTHCLSVQPVVHSLHLWPLLPRRISPGAPIERAYCGTYSGNNGWSGQSKMGSRWFQVSDLAC